MRETIREAVSLVLRRSDADEFYLVHRNPALRFFGGFWAFPGGSVQADDALAAPGDAAAASPGTRFDVAAAREALEELGLSLCDRSFDTAARTALLEDSGRFATLLADGRIVADALSPLIRLTTPAFSPIRYETHFLQVDLRSLPHASEPSIVAGELDAGEWDRAESWLRRWRQGELLIAPPVLLLLQLFAEHGYAAASEPLRRLESDFETGTLHPIYYNPGVQLLPLRTPTLPPATHTNAYVVGEDPAYLVDPATPHPEEQDRLLAALEQVDKTRNLRAILLTHHHPDHVGAVQRVRRARSLPVWAHAETAQLLAESIRIDRSLDDGERLPLGRSADGRQGWELECIFTPGHAAGHLCFYESRYGSLLCGDMMSTLSSILIHPDDGDMQLYMDSLNRLAQAFDVQMLFPAHGPATARGREVLLEQLEHRRGRERAVLAALAAGAADTASIVEQVYRDIPSAMHAYAALSVESILRKLRREDRVPQRFTG